MRRRTRQSGYALVSTMVCLVLMMLLWTAAFSHLGGYLRLEKAVQTREARDDGATRALAWGLSLLETNLPPSNPYSCRVDPGFGQEFVITYTSAETLRYAVSVRPATNSDSMLPLAPNKF